MFSTLNGDGLSFRWIMQMAGDRELTRPYAQHPYVNACVGSIAKAVSSVPLVLSKETPNGSQPVEDGALHRLLVRPNSLMSQRKFLKSLTQTQQLYGETFLILMVNRDGVVYPIDPTTRIQVPDELWPVRGDLMEEVIDERTKMPRAWRMETGQGTIEIDAGSVVHIAEANPYSPIRGLAPMAAAFRTAAKDFIVDRYDEALLQNGGSPGGILSVDGHLTDADQRAIKSAWRESHERTDQHRKTAVLPQGTSYKEVGFSPQEMEFREMRIWDRETIMAVFGVTKPIIGLTEGLNYASSQQAFRSFWDVTVLPFLDFIADELQTKFIHRLTGIESTYRISFDTDGVAALREDIDSKVDRTIKLFKDGGRSFNEAASLAGWDIDDVEGGEDRYPPGATQVGDGDPMDVDAAPADVPASETESERTADPTATLNGAQISSLMAIVKAVGLGELTKETAIELIVAAFPFDRDRAEQIIGNPPPPKAPPAAPDGKALETREVNWPAGLETPQSREKYWREWDADMLKHEAKIAAAAKRVLRDLLLKIRATLRREAAKPKGSPAGGVTKQIFTEAEIARLLDLNMDKWEEAFQVAVGTRVTETIVASAMGTHLEITGGMEGFFLTATDPTVLRYLAEREWILAGVPRHLVDDVQRAVVRVLAEEGAAYGTLREAIFATLDQSEAFINTTMQTLGTRAAHIARTETTAGANYGRQKQMLADGIRSNIWLAKPSARPHHIELDGREVPIGDSFGFNLKYPGDPSGSAEDTINCRCVLLPGHDREE